MVNQFPIQWPLSACRTRSWQPRHRGSLMDSLPNFLVTAFLWNGEQLPTNSTVQLGGCMRKRWREYFLPWNYQMLCRAVKKRQFSFLFFHLRCQAASSLPPDLFEDGHVARLASQPLLLGWFDMVSTIGYGYHHGHLVGSINPPWNDDMCVNAGFTFYPQSIMFQCAQPIHIFLRATRG